MSAPTRLWVTAVPDEASELELLDRVIERRRGMRVLLADAAAEVECERHGRAPADHSDACGCFPAQREWPYPGKRLTPGCSS